jgi:hypothetical protein
MATLARDVTAAIKIMAKQVANVQRQLFIPNCGSTLTGELLDISKSLGSDPGWYCLGFPIVSIDDRLYALPESENTRET